MHQLNRIPPYAALAAALALAAGCAELQSAIDHTGQLAAPEVALGEVKLVSAPTQQALRAYACPRVLAEQTGLGAPAELACRGLFGPAPAAADMEIAFDVHLDVANPNRVPLPLSALLTAVRVFPEQDSHELGAACVRLCPPEDDACAGAEADACREGATDVSDPEAVQRALGHLLVSQGIRLAAGGELDFDVPRVPAQQSLALVARFSLDPQALLPLVEKVARDSLADFKAGKPVSFVVPYALEGTLFAEGGAFGRLSAPYGPLHGTFDLPNVIGQVHSAQR